MKKMAFLLLCILLSQFIYIPSSSAQPTEDSLIEAWEKIQKSDPKVVTLEKLGNNHYKFKTEHFPYNGELRIINIIMDDVGSIHETDYIFGTVQVELLGLPANFLKQYTYNYSVWSKNNMLYYNKIDGKWISSQQFNTAMTNKVAKMYNSSWGISDYVMIAFALVGIVILFRISRKNKIYMKTALQKQEEGVAKSEAAIQLNEKGVQLAEDTNKLLKEILEELKTKN